MCIEESPILSIVEKRSLIFIGIPRCLLGYYGWRTGASTRELKQQKRRISYLTILQGNKWHSIYRLSSCHYGY